MSGAGATFEAPENRPTTGLGSGGSTRNLQTSALPPLGQQRVAGNTDDRPTARLLPLRDPRKFRYDIVAARTRATINFSVSKTDRLDAVAAGAMLHRIHEAVGIDREVEERILAFDKALFFEHTINGASVLQPDRGVIDIGDRLIDLSLVMAVLGNDARRFFRAYADDVAAVNREVLAEVSQGDYIAAEKRGQLLQVAFERGLEKFPYLAHDSADACLLLNNEERNALAASKRLVLTNVVSDPYARYQSGMKADDPRVAIDRVLV